MELEANFGPFDLVREAEAKIETLVMAKGSRSANYFMEFNRLASCIQWDDHALSHTSVNLSLIKRISRCAQSAKYIGSADGRPRYYLGPFQKD